MMKRILTTAFALALVALGAATSNAIDAKKKSGATTSQTAAPADSNRVRFDARRTNAATSKSLLERLKRDVRESSKVSDSNRYDNYIDANNDGVDDRISEKPRKKEVSKVKAQSAPANDTSSAPSKKKRRPK